MTYKKIFISLLGLSLFAPAFASAQLTPANTEARPEVKAELRTNATTTRPAQDAATEEKIRRAKMFAEQEIERRVRALASTTDKINLMDRVSETFKMDLRAKLNAELQHISALRARIASSTNPDSLKTDVQSITRSHRTFALVVPKAHITAAAERIVTMTAIMSEMGVKLKNRIDALSTSDVDTGALIEVLRSLSVHIDSANAHARSAINGIAPLVPDEGDEAVLQANQAALKAAREALRLAHQDIQEGRADIRTIIEGLKSAAQPTDDTEGFTDPAPVE